MAGKDAVRSFFGGREVVALASGTAALAMAIAECRARRGASATEVILPAYGCPDLVAACVYASVQPRLVDVTTGSWGYDPEKLKNALSDRTVAIVAVNLLGIGDDAAKLLPTARNFNVPLIQDSAQHLPRADGTWCGDYVVLSFGRGKPMNLLRGGMLVLADGNPPRSPRAPAGSLAERNWQEAVLSSRLPGLFFNALTYPPFYWWMSRLPVMAVGETRYKALDAVAELPFAAWGQIGPALLQYRQAPSYRSAPWSDAVRGWQRFGIEPLHAAMGPPPGQELLRLPLLAPDRETRDRLVDRLDRHGLGASKMYSTALNRAAGIPESVAVQGPFPNAEKFADRLFTLPTHSLVSARVIGRTDAIVRACVAARVS